MKKLFILVVLVTSTVFMKAQVNPTTDEEKNMKTLAKADSGWTIKGSVNIGTTFTYFSQWAAGGINSVGINGLFNPTANYRNGKTAWDNSLLIGYGMLRQGFDKSIPWIKTDDRLDLTSKFGRQINEKLYYAALFNFNTQFSPGFAPGANGLPDRTAKISDLLAPARMLFSLGLDYKPNGDLSVFISPITYRAIIVNNQNLADAGAFGVEKATYDTLGNKLTDGANIRSEVGAYMRVNYSKKFNDNVSLTSKLELFSNYLENPQNVDINFENVLATKLGKYLSLTVSAQWIYDDNTIITKQKDVEVAGTTVKVPYASKGLQFKGVTSIGFSWNF
ncbi:MAG: DUF3078 domain-containing protein [Flavobacteriales bacterium]|nr:DUF3078 domain-containing protein [Flavobacteriales bacterium]